MKKRLLIGCGVALVILVGLLLLFPTAPMVLRGWIRHEPFYQGKPASYWREEVLNSIASPDWKLRPEPFWPATLDRVLKPAQTDAVTRYFGFTQRDGIDAAPMWGDPAAVPVLIELTKPTKEQVVFERDEGDNRMVRLSVRVFALGHLGRMGSAAEPAVPTLKLALNDDDPFIRAVAADSLKKIDPEAAAQAGAP